MNLTDYLDRHFQCGDVVFFHPWVRRKYSESGYLQSMLSEKLLGQPQTVCSVSRDRKGRPAYIRIASSTEIWPPSFFIHSREGRP